MICTPLLRRRKKKRKKLAEPLSSPVPSPHPEEEAPFEEINQSYRAENENDDDDYELTPRQKKIKKRIRGRKGEDIRCINSRTSQTFPFNSIL